MEIDKITMKCKDFLPRSLKKTIRIILAILQFRIKHKKVPMGEIKDKKTLDIGCGRNKLDGAIGLDHIKSQGVDIVADLNTKLPFKDEVFEVVHANQVLEHVDDLIGLVYEIHRILKPGGFFLAHVPHFRSAWAHMDPTHLRSFAINTMDYFAENTWLYENFRFKDYGFRSIDVYLDTDYPSTIMRKFFTSLALKNEWRSLKFENSFLSPIYPFQTVTYLFRK